MEFRKILVPSELDELSAKAIHFAVQLADRLDIQEVILLNIIIPAQTQAMAASGGAANSPMALTGEFNATLEKKHKRLTSEIAGRYSTDTVRVKPVVRFSGSKSNLNEYMEEFEADLIVAASRDHETFLEKIFGSETHRMIHQNNYPMIVLKGGTEIPKFNDIGLAIDVREEEQKGIGDVVDFANRLSSKLQMVHVITEDDGITPDEAIEKLRDLAERKKFTNYAINVVNNSNLEEGLRHFVRKYNPGILAVLTEGKGKLRTLIYGSDAEDIVKEIDKPVLVNKMSD